jgi:putative transposase
MLKAFEYRIYPTAEQKEQIAKHIGCARWMYNYALEKKMKAWTKDKKSLSRFDIQADLPALKKAEDTKWLKEVNSQSLQASLEHLDRAYTKFFKEKKGFPKFKNKHKSKQSFSIPQHTDVNFEKCLLLVPKMKPIEIRLHREFKGKIKTITIKKISTNKYFASILVETKDLVKKSKTIKANTAIGLDLGIKDFAVLSTGEKISNPKILKQYEHKLKKAQQKVSKRAKGGKNREKAKLGVAKVHEKITNTRKDFLHKLSHKLTHENQVNSIVIEDLNVSGMIKNHKLAKSISDCSWSEFVRQLEYKSKWYGKNLIKIGRFEPSSKLCSDCGAINQELTLKDREWACKSCGIIHDRDINAAINIKNIGLKTIPMERRKLTLGENRGSNLIRLTQEAFAFRQG